MNDKSARIKNIVTKIDIEKINSYLQEHSSSKTLKEIVKYSKRILDSNDDKKVFKLAVDTAYNLDTLINKTSYVKNKEEKKLLLEIAKELFENTIGYKE